MRRAGYKKLFVAVLALTMVASLSMAEEINRYRSSGDWFTVYDGVENVGWNNGHLPTVAEDARMNWANGTVTLTNGTVVVGSLQTGRDEPGNCVIANGGELSTSLSVVTNNSVIGYNNVGTLTVETGGTALFRSDFVVGFLATGSGTVNIDGGTITVEGDIRVGQYGAGSVYVNQDGILNLSGLATNGVDSIGVGSRIDIGGTGQVIISGDVADVVDLYIANGTLLGNGVTSNINVEVNSDGGGTKTILTANVVVPNLLGYDLGAATNSLINLGYTVGTVSYSYVPEEISNQVQSQDPAGGTGAPAGTAVDLVVQEPLGPNVLNRWYGTVSDDWMNPTNWNQGVVPYKETQGFRVNFSNGGTLVLTNTVRVFELNVGDGGPIGVTNALTVTGGGQLLAGRNSLGATTFMGIGWSRGASLTIETNSLVYAANRVLFGREGLLPHGVWLDVDGGTFICESWMSVGSVQHDVFGTITIDNGGFFSVGNFYDGLYGANNSTNGVINLLDGTLEMKGDQTNFVAEAISNGFIVPAPGLPYTLDYNVTASGRTTLRLIRPGYSNWAKIWGVDIGQGTDDYDNDQVDNLLEYALNGDPTNQLNTGVAPVLEDDGGVIKYIHLSRADDPNLVYTVQTKDDLIYGTWIDGGTVVVGTEVTGGAYNTVTNLVTPVKDQSFLRIKVDNP